MEQEGLTPEQNLLKRAANEITSLRQNMSHMSGRLSMFDDMMTVLRANVPGNGRCSTGAEDIVYAIDRSITRSLSKGMTTAPTTGPSDIPKNNPDDLMNKKSVE